MIRVFSSMRACATKGVALVVAFAAVCGAATGVRGQVINQLGAAARGLDVNEHLNAPLPMDLAFTNQDGKRVTLGEYFASQDGKGPIKPAVVGLVYYTCPIICNTLITTVVDCAAGIETLAPGDDYNVLMFSFDERDNVAVAEAKRHAAIEQFPERMRAQAEEGLQFHVSDPGTARQLANAFGFMYRKLEDSGEFAHPVVFFMVTPDGRISRYMYGFGHTPLQLRLALLEAGDGKIVPSLKDRIVTFCYMFDPTLGRYTLSAVRVMQLAGVATLLGLGSLIGVMLVNERIRRRSLMPASVDSAGGAGKGASNEVERKSGVETGTEVSMSRVNG